MSNEKKQRFDLCAAGLSESGLCAHADCAAAHEVSCCGDCAERAHCMSGCGLPETPEPEELRVWVKAPGRAPEERRVPNTLEALQALVDGYIETVTVCVGKSFLRPYEGSDGRKGQAVTYVRELVVICNEEGRIIGYPSNCKLGGVRFVGTIVIAGVKGEEFTDAPEEDVLRMIFPRLFAAERKEGEA